MTTFYRKAIMVIVARGNAMLWSVYYRNREFAFAHGDPLLGTVEAETQTEAEAKSASLDQRAAGVLAVKSQADRLVEIPACEEHEGHYSAKVAVRWVCPTCGGPRGEVTRGISYDGSRRLGVDTWKNPCGHVDKYVDVLREAKALGASVVVASR